MATRKTAWLTETTAREKNLTQIGVTLLGAIFYVVLASSCGTEPAGDESTSAASPDVIAGMEETTSALRPTVVKALPADGTVVLSETIIRVVFSEPMANGAEEALTLVLGALSIAGERAWDTTRTVLAFRPMQALAVGEYALTIDETAAAADGATLTEPYIADFTVAAGADHK